jgi:hypothetical protein
LGLGDKMRRVEEGEEFTTEVTEGNRGSGEDESRTAALQSVIARHGAQPFEAQGKQDAGATKTKGKARG